MTQGDGGYTINLKSVTNLDNINKAFRTFSPKVYKTSDDPTDWEVSFELQSNYDYLIDDHAIVDKSTGKVFKLDSIDGILELLRVLNG